MEAASSSNIKERLCDTFQMLVERLTALEHKQDMVMKRLELHEDEYAQVRRKHDNESGVAILSSATHGLLPDCKVYKLYEGYASGIAVVEMAMDDNVHLLDSVVDKIIRPHLEDEHKEGLGCWFNEVVKAVGGKQRWHDVRGRILAHEQAHGQGSATCQDAGLPTQGGGQCNNNALRALVLLGLKRMCPNLLGLDDDDTIFNAMAFKVDDRTSISAISAMTHFVLSRLMMDTAAKGKMLFISTIPERYEQFALACMGRDASKDASAEWAKLNREDQQQLSCHSDNTANWVMKMIDSHELEM